MTIEERISELLVENGMWPQDVPKVMEATKAVFKGDAYMNKVWTEATQNYPAAITSVLWLTAKREALKWIDANCPQAWYREMFVDQATEPSPSGQ